jgi:hypothetical protein
MEFVKRNKGSMENLKKEARLPKNKHGMPAKLGKLEK